MDVAYEPRSHPELTPEAYLNLDHEATRTSRLRLHCSGADPIRNTRSPIH